jgi:hypothetical protein
VQRGSPGRGRAGGWGGAWRPGERRSGGDGGLEEYHRGTEWAGAEAVAERSWDGEEEGELLATVRSSRGEDELPLVRERRGCCRL